MFSSREAGLEHERLGSASVGASNGGSSCLAMEQGGATKIGDSFLSRYPIHSASDEADHRPPSSSSAPFDPLPLRSSSISASTSSSLPTLTASSESVGPRRRTPTFAEYRAYEPPQARLIRLRSVFERLIYHECPPGRVESFPANGGGAPGGKSSTWAGSGDAKGAQTPPPSDHLKRSQHEYAHELIERCRCRHQEPAPKPGPGGDMEATGREEKGDSQTSTWTSWVGLGPGPDQARAPSTRTSASAGSSGAAAQSSHSFLGFLPRPSSFPSSASSSSGDRRNSAHVPRRPSSAVEELLRGTGVVGLAAVPNLDSSALSGSLSAVDAETGGSERGGFSSWNAWFAGGAQEGGVKKEKEGKGKGNEDRRRVLEWEGFLRYADEKERELYQTFTELDKNGDMRLDVGEIRTAMDRAGIDLPPDSLNEFIATISFSHATTGFITFPQFRDYLLLLPRRASMPEIYRFYQARRAHGLFGLGGIFGDGWGTTARGATMVNADGDVSLSPMDRKSRKGKATAMTAGSKGDGMEENKEHEMAEAASSNASKSVHATETDKEHADGRLPEHRVGPLHHHGDQEPEGEGEEEGNEEEGDEEAEAMDVNTALRFLLAGGIAGAVSRTATAPFDRLKVYLITRTANGDPLPSIPSRPSAAAPGSVMDAGKEAAKVAGKAGKMGAARLIDAVIALYREGGGLKAFWIGNGLNCVKVFPESAIKFLSYETSKRLFARYVDDVPDSRMISGTSRFLSGGIGGITSQLAIYPIETLKTRLMSSTGGSLSGHDLLVATAKDMWRKGGLRLYYRGLTAGLIGVFPYSAIDMSTFEGLKLAYIKYTKNEEPGVFALLAFGSISGSVGATSVYPLNLIRTRLQAQGTSAHPRVYKGFLDCVQQTYKNEGIVGFYRGLVPTLAKVVPAVSISYVVYEHSKKKLGVY